MMNAEKDSISVEPKPSRRHAGFSLLRTILSLAAFIAVDYMIFRNWRAVFLLVSVIFIHESGHFIAMKAYGYKEINMTFVPFMGAFVSGRATHFSKYKKIVMLLAGPLPGVLIGMTLLFSYNQHNGEYYYWSGTTFIVLNLFNLLPVNPLDGGRVIEVLFNTASLFIQIIFLYGSLLIVCYLLYAFHLSYMIVIALFIFTRIRSVNLTCQVRRALNKKGIPYNCNYEDLSDEHYTQIRDALISKSYILGRRFAPGEHSIAEGELTSYVEKILIAPDDYELTKHQQVMVMLAYLLAFILPAIQWYIKMAVL